MTMSERFQPVYYVFVDQGGLKVWRGETRRATPPTTFEEPFVCQEDEFDFEPLPLRDGYEVVVDLEAAKTYYQPTDPTLELLVNIRQKRNQLLDECDLVYCNAERWETFTAEQKEAWRWYKQALKDFPAYCDPYNPVWPVLPV
jgi:hypothetical protein